MFGSLLTLITIPTIRDAFTIYYNRVNQPLKLEVEGRPDPPGGFTGSAGHLRLWRIGWYLSSEEDLRRYISSEEVSFLEVYFFGRVAFLRAPGDTRRYLSSEEEERSRRRAERQRLLSS